MAVGELTKDDYKKQHVENYKKALIDIVHNNNKRLLDEDILSLIKKPPLDSMDTIKTKLIVLAKTERIILEGGSVDKVVSTYRQRLSDDMVDLLDNREEKFISKINDFSPSRDTEVLKIELRDFDEVNKEIKSRMKKIINCSIDSCIINNVDVIYKKETKEKEKLKINKAFSSFLKNEYQKKLLNDIEIKMIVKDRTLINGINEQGERYLFTLEKSYLLK